MKRTRKICYLLVVVVAVGALFALQVRGESSSDQTPEPQNKAQGYAPALNIPILLSSNYGELRSNHFHSGVDIKTQGVTGKPVLAVASGYVSRVFVSPTGFGKALYIAHPDGTTSVYGHVECFTPAIDAYVTQEQYARKSFAVDLTPDASRFPVTRGEQVATSGNRGSSGGPHLHLEVRDGAQRPYNLLANNMMSVSDTIPPKPVTLYYVEVDTVQGIPVHRVVERLTPQRTGAHSYVLPGGKPLQMSPHGYLAVEVNELKNGTTNPMGVYRVQGTWDGKPYFEMAIDRIPFDLSRYANTVSLYGESRGKSNGVYRLYLSPNNPLAIYKGVLARGVLTPQAGTTHNVTITLEDDSQNSAVLTFTAVERTTALAKSLSQGNPVYWNQDFQWDEAGLAVKIPSGALYESILLETSALPQPTYGYSPIFRVHTPDEPLQGYITLTLNADALPASLRSKALLGILAPAGTRSSAGGAWKADAGSGGVEARVRDFGSYYIAVDTTAPRITPSFKEGEDFGTRQKISLVISDEFSGINTYSATIDGQWALFEYDPKTKHITHFFDQKRWPQTGKHTLNLTVTDGKGNSTTFTGSYTR